MAEYLHPTLTPDQRKTLSSLALAHVGDAVFEVMVRTYLSTHGAYSSRMLHRATVERVSAIAQAKAVDRILPVLTEEESAVFRRGRNASPRTIPKSCTREEYAKATALETLWGDLFLQGDQQRLEELFQLILSEE